MEIGEKFFFRKYIKKLLSRHLLTRAVDRKHYFLGWPKGNLGGPGKMGGGF